MRSVQTLGKLLVIAALAAPAIAQERASVEEVMARIVRNALAPSSYGDWSYRWDAVSIRISSLMHWHLPGRDDPDAASITRRGWIAASGPQIAVAAWGEDETVSSLTFEVKSWRRDANEHEAIMSALAAEGVTAVETEWRDPPDFFYTATPIIVYRLTAPDRDTGSLSRSEHCTSPHSAAARSCSVSYALALGG